MIGAMQAERHAHFWAAHSGPELDLVVPRGGRLYGFECKFTDDPDTTPSMRAATIELDLERLFLVYPGSRRFELGERVEALPLADVAVRLADL